MMDDGEVRWMMMMMDGDGWDGWSDGGMMVVMDGGGMVGDGDGWWMR